DLSTVPLDPARLRQLFERLFRVEQAVIFFDEFEYLGLRRNAQTATEPLTAELLRCLPLLRASGQALAVCATNHVGVLDPALLRPGRFDLILPMGLPDAAERRSLFDRLLARHRRGLIDLDLVVAQSDGLTPADLEAVCQRAAQTAFEREIADGADSHVTTEDLVQALDLTRPTVSAEELRTFEREVESFARL
ncbi:MAG TPA: ATP-binding protein, partial [Dehalococcoidia bacterium]|nr:ATP-binding protein [Dehalococcoidia bacterium]